MLNLMYLLSIIYHENESTKMKIELINSTPWQFSNFENHTWDLVLKCLFVSNCSLFLNQECEEWMNLWINFTLSFL